MAPAAFRGEWTICELAQQFVLHPDQVTQWKKQLSDAAAVDVFSSTTEPADVWAEIRRIQQKIGPLALRRDSLICEVSRPEGFTEVQPHGPVAHWKHRHLLIVNHGEGSILPDNIEYRLPLVHSLALAWSAGGWSGCRTTAMP